MYSTYRMLVTLPLGQHVEKMWVQKHKGWLPGLLCICVYVYIPNYRLAFSAKGKLFAYKLAAPQLPIASAVMTHARMELNDVSGSIGLSLCANTLTITYAAKVFLTCDPQNGRLSGSVLISLITGITVSRSLYREDYLFKGARYLTTPLLLLCPRCN